MRLVIAGGGTGGHLFPGIAVAKALMDLDKSSEILFVGTERGIEFKEVPKAGFRLETIEIGGLKRVGVKKLLQTLTRLPRAHLASRRILKAFSADAVLGVGGYASGPVVLAGKSLGLPTAICEQNSVPGLTNRLLTKVVRRVYASFEVSRSYFPSQKFALVGNPVRRSFVYAASQNQSEVEAGMVFTFGGSQGARPLNETVPAALGILAERGIEVHALHQAGHNDVESVSAAYAAASVDAEVTPFIGDMVGAYRKAQLVVCRAGATSCAELTALGVPSILVPFPQAADDHQTLNAQDLASAQAAILLTQDHLEPEILAEKIGTFLTDPQRRKKMADAALALGHLDAAQVVARAAQQGFPMVSNASEKRAAA